MVNSQHGLLLVVCRKHTHSGLDGLIYLFGCQPLAVRALDSVASKRMVRIWKEGRITKAERVDKRNGKDEERKDDGVGEKESREKDKSRESDG